MVVETVPTLMKDVGNRSNKQNYDSPTGLEPYDVDHGFHCLRGTPSFLCRILLKAAQSVLVQWTNINFTVFLPLPPLVFCVLCMRLKLRAKESNGQRSNISFMVIRFLESAIK